MSSSAHQMAFRSCLGGLFERCAGVIEREGREEEVKEEVKEVTREG